jgi:two-component system cell cycle response regulator
MGAADPADTAPMATNGEGESAGRTGVPTAFSRTWACLSTGLGSAEWRAIVGPSVFLFLAVGLLIYDHQEGGVNATLFWLCLALLIAVFARMLETIGSNARLLTRFRRDSMLDDLTGLGNRSKLEANLETPLEASDERLVLVLFEIAGLQAYGNRFGHAEAERLLCRLAERLATTVSPLDGGAYRVDADHFVALLPADGDDVGEVVTAATASLGKDDEELLTSISFGEVGLPDDAIELGQALQIAGRRLAARKGRQVRSARRQAYAVLMAALDARRPELRRHLRAVAPRAIAIGRRLGLDPDELDDVVLAAALQDIGLLTVPERLLEKPGPLTEGELVLIREHPLAGERIVSAAPALAPVGTLVRSSYERFDGTGYPDGLSGEEIPLGARIISVCVAAAAISSPRPQRPARDLDEMIAELRACAGTQFDPRVVEALVEDLDAESKSPESGEAETETDEMPAVPSPVQLS